MPRQQCQPTHLRVGTDAHELPRATLVPLFILLPIARVHLEYQPRPLPRNQMKESPPSAMGLSMERLEDEDCRSQTLINLIKFLMKTEAACSDYSL